MLLHAITVINGISKRFLFHEGGVEFFYHYKKLQIRATDFLWVHNKNNHNVMICLFAWCKLYFFNSLKSTNNMTCFSSQLSFLSSASVHTLYGSSLDWPFTWESTAPEVEYLLQGIFPRERSQKKCRRGSILRLKRLS